MLGVRLATKKARDLALCKEEAMLATKKAYNLASLNVYVMGILMKLMMVRPMVSYLENLLVYQSEMMKVSPMDMRLTMGIRNQHCLSTLLVWIDYTKFCSEV